MNNSNSECIVVLAHSFYEYEIAKALFLEYAGTLEFDLCFQNFENEMENISVQYNYPSGGILLLKHDRDYAGCVGIRKFEDTIAELKRMYIQPEYRGNGYGKILLNEAIKLSAKLGYTLLRLDTIKTMKAAIMIYEEAGFREIQAYRHNPIKDVKYYELNLAGIM
jgi:GNAT superfamily N-acetyltransferase